ncbi:nucleoside hydrolase [Paenibacillus tyrfis]|uniref:Nucleoside hydrolase n=1 Tax=Paenibacillus tyrfis TaxID=1501230 RepID=A0A081P288_9BACL|nr:nucleoside hydrolase [Paenibacillus tyrfis]KEQ24811.1 nucleoside hydrolase [Paenibacillus tyrfis]
MDHVQKIIIDADTGIDDALAILYALKAPAVRVEGITTVFGNISVRQATDNTLRLLRLADAGYEVPVVQGAEGPLVRKLEGSFATHVHGVNGIGNVELPPADQQPLAEAADDFIIRKADELNQELVLVTLGRLTNLAQALAKDPALPAKIKHVYVMGGTIHSPGNVTPVAEANIWGDPEAADAVFSSGLPVTMVGLDVTMKTRLTRHHLDFLQRHGKEENRKIVDFICDSMPFYFGYYRASNYFLDSAPLHDPLTVLAAVEPAMMAARTMKVKVECESTLCRGMTVADLRRNPTIGSPIRVCVDVDAELAVGKLLSVFV